MGKEATNNLDQKSGGDGQDGLEQASEQAAKLNDNALARLFLDANEEAQEKNIPPARELFIEEKESQISDDLEPDQNLLKDIYESLSRKEIHHKKLLEENDTTNRILKVFQKIKHWFQQETRIKNEQVVITPLNWKIFSYFVKEWKKKNSAYFGNFAIFTDIYLRKAGFAKYMLKWEMGVMFAILLLSCPLIAIFSKSATAVSETDKAFANSWSTFILSSAVIACVLAIIPIFFFLSLWFVNVNHLHTSKYFHLFLFSSFTVSFIFMALAIFNSGLYYIVDVKFGLTTPSVQRQ